jgi:hypothetical protein
MLAESAVSIPLSSSEIQHIASETAKAAVRETLLTLGVNIEKPDAILKMQQDFAYLRDWREASGTIKARTITTLVGILVTGLVGAVWLALTGGRH